MSFFWHLDPFVSVGSIRFGQDAQSFIDEYNLHLVPPIPDPEIEEDDWETYEFEDCESRIYVEEGRIDRVGCFDELFYKGKNLFGMSVEEIRAHLGKEDEIGEEVGGEIPFEYDRLGIQVWFEDGFVTSVMCTGPVPDD